MLLEHCLVLEGAFARLSALMAWRDFRIPEEMKHGKADRVEFVGMTKEEIEEELKE